MIRAGLLLPVMLGACQGSGPEGVAATDSADTATDSGGVEAFSCPEAPALGEVSTEQWTLLDRPVGGDFLHLLESEAQPLRVFAGSTMNGLYRSDDGGQSWTKLPLEVTHMAGQLAADPDDAERVYATTGELWRSTNGGLGWERTGFGEESLVGQRVRGMVHHEGALVLLDSLGGVWRSEDGAVTIEQIGTIEPMASAAAPPPHGYAESTFEVDETHAWLAQGDGALYAVHHGSALYRSTDGGRTWQALLEGELGVWSLGASGQHVWVATPLELFVSSDLGESFSRVDTLEQIITGGVLLEGDELLLSAEDRVYGLGDGFISERLSVEGAHGLRQPLLLSDGSVLLGDQDGVFRSTDGAASFELSADGVEVNDLGPLLAHSECAQLVWTGTQCERGLFASAAYGEDLVYVDEYLHYVMVPRESPARPWEIWVTTDDMLKRSLDLGQTWEQVAEEQLTWHLHGLAIHPEDPELILVGTVGSGTAADERARVLRSEDHGATWTESSTGLPETEESVHALHFVQTEPEVVLAGTFRGGDMGHASGLAGIGMFRSTDRGLSWTEVGPEGLDDVPVFAECQGRLYAATNLGLLRSEDAGATWEDGSTWTEATAAEGPVLSVACRGEEVLAMEAATIWRSSDGGESWTDWSEGVDTMGVFPRSMPQLAFGADGELVYAAVPGLGLLRRAL